MTPQPKTKPPRVVARFDNKPPAQAAQIMAELIFSRLNRAPELRVVKDKVA